MTDRSITRLGRTKPPQQPSRVAETQRPLLNGTQPSSKASHTSFRPKEQLSQRDKKQASRFARLWLLRRGTGKRKKMSGPLAIRNLTGQRITLVSVERFERSQISSPQENQDGNGTDTNDGNNNENAGAFAAVSRVASNMWNVTSSAVVTSSTASATSKVITDDMKSIGDESIEQQIEASGLFSTDMAWSKEQVIKVKIDIDGSGRFTATLPSSEEHSNTLQPIENASGEYSTIFLKQLDTSTLTILPTPKLSSWMTPLDSNIPLSHLSLPGTHNSPTYYTALPSVRCQVVSPLEQLRNGIRFFDIRLQPPAPTDTTNTSLTLVHGVFPISLTGAKYFKDLFADMKSFLAENPGETIICSLKREGVGEHTDAQLATLLRKEYFAATADDSKQWWFLEPRIPRLGEARGKIVVLRRFGLDEESQAMFNGRGIGIDAANWAYNTKCDEREHVVVQDLCEVLETVQIDDKISACCSFLDRSGATSLSAANADETPRPLHLNFLSASNFWRVGCWPDKIAAKLNPAVLLHLCTKNVIEHDGGGSTGIVVCDWVGANGDWDLVKCIVGMNGKVGVQAA